MRILWELVKHVLLAFLIVMIVMAITTSQAVDEPTPEPTSVWRSRDSRGTLRWTEPDFCAVEDLEFWRDEDSGLIYIEGVTTVVYVMSIFPPDSNEIWDMLGVNGNDTLLVIWSERDLPDSVQRIEEGSCVGENPL